VVDEVAVQVGYLWKQWEWQLMCVIVHALVVQALAVVDEVAMQLAQLGAGITRKGGSVF